VRWSCKELSL